MLRDLMFMNYDSYFANFLTEPGLTRTRTGPETVSETAADAEQGSATGVVRLIRGGKESRCDVRKPLAGVLKWRT